MKAHQIQNGVVINTIIVETLDVIPDLIEATEGGIGWLWDGASLTAPTPEPVAPQVPQSVTPRQIRQGLTAIGLRAAVEAAIAAADQDTKDWYEFATEFRRDHPSVAGLAVALNVTAEQLDGLWTLAATL